MSDGSQKRWIAATLALIWTSVCQVASTRMPAAVAGIESVKGGRRVRVGARRAIRLIRADPGGRRDRVSS